MKFSAEYTKVPQEFTERCIRELEPYRSYLEHIMEEGGYTKPECSINAPADKSILATVKGVVEKFDTQALKYVIIVGIGGANLGAKAVYEALLGSIDTLDSERQPRLIFVDSISAKFLSGLKELLKKVETLDQILVNCVSKSGTTVETIFNAEIVINMLTDRFGETAVSRIIITSGATSPLWDMAEDHNLPRLSVPACVGDRYSVFTAVGLCPLFLSGISIARLLEGAQSGRDLSISSTSTNGAIKSAIALYYSLERGQGIHNSFLFGEELESLGKWYRQLVGESLGKEKTVEGDIVNIGITPIVSIGSTDLHSVGQLYFGGPRDKITTFVSAKRAGSAKKISMPENRFFSDLLDGLNGETASTVTDAILTGTKEAYKNDGLPYMEITLENVDEFSLGEFMQFKMFEIMYLAKLMKVDAFDQPSVENYKAFTHKILKNK